MNLLLILITVFLRQYLYQMCYNDLILHDYNIFRSIAQLLALIIFRYHIVNIVYTIVIIQISIYS